MLSEEKTLITSFGDGPWAVLKSSSRVFSIGGGGTGEREGGICTALPVGKNTKGHNATGKVDPTALAR